MPMMRPIPETGRPTESNTMASVTRPTDGNAGGADGGERCGRDNGQVIRRGQRDTERLRNEYNGYALHDRGAVHVDGRTEPEW